MDNEFYPNCIELHFGYVETYQPYLLFFKCLKKKRFKSKQELFHDFCNDVWFELYGYLQREENYFSCCGEYENCKYKSEKFVNLKGASPQKIIDSGDKFCANCGRDFSEINGDISIDELNESVRRFLVSPNSCFPLGIEFSENWHPWLSVKDLLISTLMHKDEFSAEILKDCILCIEESADGYITRYIWERILNKESQEYYDFDFTTIDENITWEKYLEERC